MSDPEEPDLDLARVDAARGQRLPRCRRPARRRTALRARPDLGARRRAPHRRGGHHLPCGPHGATLPARPRAGPSPSARWPSTASRSPFARRGKDLVLRAPIEEDQRYELSLDYVGTPEPVPAPTTRSDFSTTGFTVTRKGEVWTMQEPYGAYTWYPVNDQPSDKALYDITVHAPAQWTGISNGELTEFTSDARGHDHVVAARRAGVVVPHHARDRRLRPQQQHLRRRAAGGLLDAARHEASARLDQDRGRDRRLGRDPARRLPVRLPRPRRHRLAERDGDPDDGHARHQRLRPLAAGRRARDRPPVVRRPGLAGGLARRVAQRGHDDAAAVGLRGRARPPAAAPERCGSPAPPTSSCATSSVRPAPTTRASSAAPTSTTRPR